jgi:hypothetical protein
MIPEQQREKTRRINAGDWSPRIDIRDSSGELIGHLAPLNSGALVMPALMEAITRWRASHAAAFITRFTPTTERTREWLREVVLQDPRRIFCIIHHQSHPVGHLGFRDLDAESYQFDNLVRGERGGGPNFMRYAAWAFHAWAMREFGVQRCWGRVLADNQPAIDFNVSLGSTLGCVSEQASAPENSPRQVATELTWDSLTRTAPPAVIRDLLTGKS